MEPRSVCTFQDGSREPTPEAVPTVEPILAPTSNLTFSEPDTCLSMDILPYLSSTAPVAAAPRVPIEVAENMIDHLVNDNRTLRQCALVCKPWSVRSRFNIWRKITVRHRAQVYALRSFLEKSPEIRELVRILDIDDGQEQISNMALVVILPMIPRADSLVMLRDIRELSLTAFAYLSIQQNIRSLTFHTALRNFVHTVRLLSHLESLETLCLCSRSVVEPENVTYPSRYDITSLFKRRTSRLRVIEVRKPLLACESPG